MADVRIARPATAGRLAVYLIKMLCAIAAFALLFKLTDFGALKAAIVRSRGGLLIAGIVASIAAQFLASQRWRTILHSGAIDVPPLFAFRLGLIGTFFGIFLPGQGSGDLVKCGLLFGDYPESRAFLIASILYDRVVGLLSMVGLAAIGSVLVGTASDLRMMHWVGLVMLSGTTVGFVLLWLFSNARTSQLLPTRWRFGIIASFAGELGGLCRNVSLAFRCCAFSLVSQLLSAVTLWLMLTSVIPAPPFLPVLLAASLSILIATIPISPGGLGVREGMFALIMHRLGLDSAAVTAAAVLGLLPLFAASVTGGLLFLLSKKNEARKDCV